MASGLAETAKLVSSLELKDNFTPAANNAIRSLGKMESTAFKVGQNIGKGINNAAHNLKRIAQVGVIGLAGAITLGAKSLGDLARAQAQTSAVIESTGGKAKVTAAQVRDMAEALEDVTTVDDKVIQDGENLLLTFTNIGSTVFPEATKAATNMAVAMAGGNVEQVDLKASAIQLGKALNDPVKGYTALQRVGVSFTAAQAKMLKASGSLSKEEQKHYAKLLTTNKAEAKRYKATVLNNKLIAAQKVILAELNTEFGKAGEAAGKGPEAVMRRLADAGEGVSQVLARGVLPVLERFGTFLTKKLADPAFLAQVDEFGRNLGEAGGKFLDFLEKVDFKAIGAALSTAATAAGTLVGWFLQMPDWVKEAVLTGWGLNKLTGGALGDIVGTLASGLIKGVLGMNAGVVNINAATVNGIGGAGAPGVAGGGGGGGLIGTALKALGVVTLAEIASEVSPELNNIGADIHKEVLGFLPTISAGDLEWPFGPKNTPTILPEVFGGNGLLGGKGSTGPVPVVIKNVSGGPDDRLPGSGQRAAAAIKDLDSSIGNVHAEQQRTAAAIKDADSSIGKVREQALATASAVKDADSSITAAASNAGVYAGNSAKTAGYVVAAAVRASVPIVNTYVNVSGVTVQQKTTVTKRYGSPGGDRVQDGSGVLHNGAD